MKVIITAAGSGSRWGNYLNRRKHEIVMDGERLIDRLARQLQSRGIRDITITCDPNHMYTIPGVISEPGRPDLSNVLSRLSTKPLWSTSYNTLIIWGDVYLTDQAMDKIVEPVHTWTQYARLSTSIVTGKPGPEIFAVQFPARDRDDYARALEQASTMKHSSWSVYCVMTNTPDTVPQLIEDSGSHVEIPDDGSDDFDFPDDYERYMFNVRNLSGRRVVANQFTEQWLLDRERELGLSHKVRRKLWEHCSIAQAALDRVNLVGAKVLGFGVGKERLPSWFTSKGASVLATDGVDQGVWLDRQYANSRDTLVTVDGHNDNILSFDHVDMNNIPPSLRGQFDLTWSSSCMEHLGSIEHGIRFMCEQMKCLKPGGIALHTTEYHYNSHHQNRLESKHLSLFTVNDLIELTHRISDQGDRLWPINLVQGSSEADLYEDREPYQIEPHLNIVLGGRSFTSVLLIGVKGQEGVS